MAKLTDHEKEEILKDQMKGYRVARKTPPVDSAARQAAAEESTPDFESLRRQFLGEDEREETDDRPTRAGGARAFGITGDSNPGHDASDDDDDVEIVPVEKETGADPWNRGARPKAVVVSRSKKKIIGSQG